MAGFQVCYEKDDQFNALMRRCSSLPFVKKDHLDEAFEIFNKRAQDLDDQDLREFSLALIESLNSQWRQGIFAVQDWNLYEINLLLVPSTNNGNEGQNQRFKENFGIHPKLWNFFLTLSQELESRSADIPAILVGALIPEQDENYHSLKEVREITKANFEAGLLNLDQMMGKIGSLSIKAKTVSDDLDDDLNLRHKPTKKSNPSASFRPSKLGNRGSSSCDLITTPIFCLKCFFYST